MTCRTDWGDPEDHDTIESHFDRKCESTIGSSPGRYGLIPFTLNVRVAIEVTAGALNPLSGIVSTCNLHGVDGDDLRTRAFNDFQQAIDRYWNNRLWLTPAVRRDTNAPKLLCAVNVSRAEAGQPPDLRIRIFHRPTPSYRAHCEIGGDAAVGDEGEPDMCIEYPMTTMPAGASNGFDNELKYNTSNHGMVLFYQNTAAHEFGHYIGLNHTCHGLPGITPNSDAEYCAEGTRNTQRDIMSTGNAVRIPHASPWLDRLQHHHIRCGLTWRARSIRLHPPGGA